METGIRTNVWVPFSFTLVIIQYTTISILPKLALGQVRHRQPSIANYENGGATPPFSLSVPLCVRMGLGSVQVLKIDVFMS